MYRGIYMRNIHVFRLFDIMQSFRTILINMINGHKRRKVEISAHCHPISLGNIDIDVSYKQRDWPS